MPEHLVIETTVLIDYRRQVESAKVVVDKVVRKGAAVVHPVSVAEVLDGALNQRHMLDSVRFLSPFPRLPVKSSDHERTILCMVEHHLSHGIGWPDCLIAATCIRLGLPLVTLNDKHFRAIPGMRVIRPY